MNPRDARATSWRMIRTPPPLLEMTPDGEIRQPSRPNLSLKVARAAIVLAVLAGALSAAALLLWFALILIPVAIGAALIGWVALRLRGGASPFPRR